MFNDRLRQIRESSGMTQIELADKIGVAATTYRNYENTSREPNYDILVKIASTLGVSVDFLLEADTVANPKLERLLLAISQLPEQALPELIDFVNFLSFKYRVIKNQKNHPR